MEELIKLTGKAVHILFRNDTNFYSVLRFKVEDDKAKLITVTGTLPEFEMDVIYHIYGNYVEHPRFGMQFQIQRYEKPLPNEKEGIVRYLSGIQFPGIGKLTAEKIVKILGEDCLTLLKEDPEILRAVPGLSDDKIQIIKDGIAKESDGMKELVQFLNVHGIGIQNLVGLNKAYGKKALEKLKEDPYRVMEECDGFGFKTADKIAMALGFSLDDNRRIRAYLISLVMEQCISTGDSYIEIDELKRVFSKKINGISCDFDEILQQAIFSSQLVNEEGRIYPISQYESEQFISQFLCEFPYQSLSSYDLNLIHDELDIFSKKMGIHYDEDQSRAIDTVFDSPITIITGGPGTGKTTVVKAITHLFHNTFDHSEIVCCAPTGRAAKRLASTTGFDATTIHSLLKWDLETNSFGKNQEDPIVADLLIVDEFSMVDTYLFANLLKACRNVKRICIIGDEDQLPSVSCGCVLRDLIASDIFPYVCLKHIYRQAQGSDVIALAHDIHDGVVDFSSYQSNVVFQKCDRLQIKNQVLSTVKDAFDKGYEMSDIQVLSPIYAGTAGIDVLNNALQEAFNPKDEIKREVKVGYTIFREHDKVLQLKNQPDDDIYNGDVGEIVEILLPNETDSHQTMIYVDFDGVIVEYKPENFNNLTLAYCMSIHKAQGSEYPIVIMPMSFQYRYMLQKKLIYTGCTRARKYLVLIGEEEAFQYGVSTLESHKRKTGLVTKLRNFQNPFDL